MSTPSYGSTSGANAEQGNDIKENTKDKAQAVTAQAKQAGEKVTQAGKEVSNSAMEGAQEVVQEARQQGMQLAHDATRQFHAVAQDATTQLREQAGTQAERAAQQLRTLSEQARAFAEGRTEEAGPLPAYAQQATQRLTEMAQRLETTGVDGVLNDARSFARRKPGTFLMLAGIAGFAAGRVLRGAKTANEASLATEAAQTGSATDYSIDLRAQERALSEARV